MNITVGNDTYKVNDIKPKGHEVVLCTDNGEYTFTWKEYGNKSYREIITTDGKHCNINGNADKYSKILSSEVTNDSN